MAYPVPQGGASLVLAFRLDSHITLVLGSGPLAASRAFAALEADSKVIIVAKGPINTACDEIQWRAAERQLIYVDWDTLPAGSSIDGEERDIQAFEFYLSSCLSMQAVRFVCMTDTLSSSQRRSRSFAEKIYQLCKAKNILVNATDVPNLCDFTFTASHRFENPATGRRTPFQIGVTTNGHGCRLSSRIKREIVARLPREIGTAVERVGYMRSLAKSTRVSDPHSLPVVPQAEGGHEEEDELDENSRITTPNRPVPSRAPSNSSYVETEAECTKRKLKWVAQVSEYWSFTKLAQMCELDMVQILSGDLRVDFASGFCPTSIPQSYHDLALSLPVSRPLRHGRIILVGSGPGHPCLLTIAAQRALTRLADLVLSDKLVPEPVLALIPSHVPITIARKFPGNADGAQEEMMREAVEAVRKGLCVVRLKQGDPQIYARTAEEILYFRNNVPEVPITIIPGVSSALAGPTYASISLTQRGVAESFVVCTGVGRKGKDVALPGYERARTTVVLMGVARLAVVVGGFLDTDESPTRRRLGAPYPAHVPIAIIERASMPDQRVITSTLRDITSAMENVGEQRPPGMMVVGWAVLGLWGNGEAGTGLLDELEGTHVERSEERLMDEERVRKWLGGAKWRVNEGVGDIWEEFERALHSEQDKEIS